MKTSHLPLLAVFGMTILMVCASAGAQTHATWPADWNDWSDSALWAKVGNSGNLGELSGANTGQGSGPQGVVGQVDSFYKIARFEVTAGQYADFLTAVAAIKDTYNLYNPMMDTATDPAGAGCNIKRQGTEGSYSYSVAGDWANRPVNWVSWGDAARYCNWLTNGKRIGGQTVETTEDGTYALNGATTDAELRAVVRKSFEAGGLYCIATENEWYKAAYHANDGATGNYYDHAAARDAEPSSLFDDPDPGNSANYDQMVGAPYFRTEAGEFELSASPYGTYDQGGNVREWNETAILTDCRGLRGGSFGDDSNPLAADWRDCALPTTEDGSTGFRIVQIPEPATLSLILAAGLPVVWKRRRMS